MHVPKITCCQKEFELEAVPWRGSVLELRWESLLNLSIRCLGRHKLTTSSQAIKHNQQIPHNHFRKDWQRRVRVHFDQVIPLSIT